MAGTELLSLIPKLADSIANTAYMPLRVGLGLSQFIRANKANENMETSPCWQRIMKMRGEGWLFLNYLVLAMSGSSCVRTAVLQICCIIKCGKEADKHKVCPFSPG